MKRQAHGFALIQTIIAIVILAIALSGAVLLMGTVIGETAINKNRIIATYLAQECLELARNARDSAWKQNLAWDCAFPDTNTKYRIWSDKDISKIGDSDNSCQLKMGIDKKNQRTLSLEDKKISHEEPANSENNMIFQRHLTISNHSDDQMTVTCHVLWSERGDDRKVTLSSILTNWKKR
jgi:type II secretory pathway pseudopilin PulG